MAASVVAIVSATGLAGCSRHESATSAVPSVLPTTSTAVALRPAASLPSADALVEVLSRLADTAVAGADKVNLVEGASPETAAALDRFTTAARDGGYLPLSFAASNVAWSDVDPSSVTVTIVVTTAKPDNHEFTFPMEFKPDQGGWQLSRRTAEMLLALSSSRVSSPGPGPPPAAVPATEPSPAPAPEPNPPSPTPSG